jgi:putative RecB family exonuclease
VSDYRSFSALKEWQDCGERYRLHRIEKAWERPAAWLPQGLAVHEAIEAYERSNRLMPDDEIVEIFLDSYIKHVNRLSEETPRWDYWFRSGPYKGEDDILRRMNIGKEQVVKYTAWTRTHHQEKVWITPDGTPAIELPIDVMFGSVRVKGYIDQLVVDWAAVDLGDPEITVRDIKTGNLPDEPKQLAIYARAVEMMYPGVKVNQADFWMGKSGKATFPYDLSEYTVDQIAEEFETMDEAVKRSDFTPNPTEKGCMFCPVASSCEFRFTQ